MSCLSSDALSHFEQREQELLALNAELDKKQAKVIAEASNAVREAESCTLRARPLRSSSGLHADDVQKQDQLPLQPASGYSDDVKPVLAAVAASVSGSRPSSSQDGAESLHATIRFQNARILALQQELDKTIADLAARDTEVQQVRQENKQVSEEVKRLQKVGSAADQGQEKLRQQVAALETKCKDLERERSDLSKEKDQLEVRLRKSDADISSKEARINRLTEECEKYKVNFKEASNQDRDRATSERRETERLTSEVRKLERQRAELVNAFKKQMKLIEVLKRQRAHMEAARVLSFTEDEFIRILELGEKLNE